MLSAYIATPSIIVSIFIVIIIIIIVIIIVIIISAVAAVLTLEHWITTLADTLALLTRWDNDLRREVIYQEGRM